MSTSNPNSDVDRFKTRILDLETEGKHAVFISHSRRDPAALNMAYAIVKAWRWGTEQDSNRSGYDKPFCDAAYLPGQKNTVVLWLDKEQMEEAGGADWRLILTQAQKKANLSIYFLGNAYAGSDECLQEFQWAVMEKLKFVPVLLETWVASEADFVTKNIAELCDSDRNTFAEWEKRKDVVRRGCGAKQGCVAHMSRDDFLCQQCEHTVREDRVCPSCSDWKRVLQTPSSEKFLEAVRTGGRYIDAGAQDSGLAPVPAESPRDLQRKSFRLSMSEPEPEPELQPSCPVQPTILESQNPVQFFGQLVTEQKHRQQLLQDQKRSDGDQGRAEQEPEPEPLAVLAQGADPEAEAKARRVDGSAGVTAGLARVSTNEFRVLRAQELAVETGGGISSDIMPTGNSSIHKPQKEGDQTLRLSEGSQPRVDHEPAPETTLPAGEPTWQYEQRGSWHPMDDESQVLVESAFDAGQSELSFETTTSRRGHPPMTWRHMIDAVNCI